MLKGGLIYVLHILAFIDFVSSQSYWIGEDQTVSWTPSQIDAKYVNIELRYSSNPNGPFNTDSAWTIMKNVPNSGNGTITKTIGGDLANSAGQLLIPNQAYGQFWASGVDITNSSGPTQRQLIPETFTVQQTVFMNNTLGFVTAAGSGASGEESINVTLYIRSDTYSTLASQGGVEYFAKLVSVNTTSLTWQFERELTANVETLKDSTSRRLLGQNSLSLYDVELGLSNYNYRRELEQLYATRTCGATFYRQSTYCQVVLTIGFKDIEGGGPYVLNVGVMNGNLTDEYYTVNDPTNVAAAYNQFIVYNASHVSIDTKLDDKIVQVIDKYQDVMLDVKLGDGLDDTIDVFVGLETLSDYAYYIECGAHKPDNFSKLGWKMSNSEGEMNIDLPTNYYYFTMYYAAYDDFSTTMEAGRFRFNGDGMGPLDVGINKTDGNETIVPAIQISNNKDLSFDKGKQNIEFVSAYSYGTKIYGYIEQCDIYNGSEPLSMIEDYSDFDVDCFDYMNESFFEFTYSQEKVTYAVTFPDELDYSNSNITTYLHLYTYACDMTTKLYTTIDLTIKKSGGSSSNSSAGLSAGAIVGIVCAGVLICGLAAWWLCMRKSKGDGYQTLEN